MSGAKIFAPVAAVCLFLGAAPALAQTDPGVQGGAARAGAPVPGLTANERIFFDAGLEDFEEAEGVGDGLGPRFNLDGCGGCHSQPAIGGTSPAVNPQFAIATAFGARNTVPSFITLNGPIREARFKRLPNGQPDGGVHALYVISQRSDGTGNAGGCNIAQENFTSAVATNNVIFRIPTPTFGMGLMESITEGELTRNLSEGAGPRQAIGITGRLNHNGNDGRVTRFGWKAQNVSGLVFSGEAYNVEMGITNEAFQVERDETSSCQFATLPNDVTATDGATGIDTVSAIEKFAFFMRFLAAPTQNPNAPGGNASISEGFNSFVNIGCAQCHTQQLRTGNSTVAALRNQSVRMFSDLAIHNMGPGLADDVSQGEARGDEFRTAPLWGLGQRVFFLHDGRTNNLLTAITAHASNANGTYQASEANTVINRFNALSNTQKQ
ncbi:MAG TPA: di-heme oxidoredictase family protein, partial [Steroidobacteraceae bacterium]|nr:di-heme oxidoredictase family protein [Steroidobacteraceae bacterium]